MTRKGLTLAAGAAVAVALMVGGRASAQNKVPREAPKFEVDPSFPKIPNNWVLGQVASAAADEKDHIWVLHRPRTVRPALKTGPPVMEFDSAGNYIQGWGDDAPGYDWPKSEHGIYIDYKGFVIEDRFVVGYGLDYGEMYRNLPFIGAIVNSRGYLIGRTLAWVFILWSNLWFFLHLVLMVFGLGRRGAQPTLLEAPHAEPQPTPASPPASTFA